MKKFICKTEIFGMQILPLNFANEIWEFAEIYLTNMWELAN